MTEFSRMTRPKRNQLQTESLLV
ncbi:hypothetical protein [Caulobacter vibrioides]|uniref:Uncharacterized protein n=1 Tax=Caulobacter vibrioides (strain NA1000 / CB15N) TaxID=565050 RepID=A0A0H3J413_CAUVN|nr:hypothetical protein [Caulobacter vibrioides]YP_009020491.1 hypothetical protein CCNA_03920 [Caulobacter vibrioides NA1000]QBQ57497.1 hypothetical protein EUX21_00520 [synthetic Caulobacter sp. 'ethensis']AHI88522.1 hypothetical protein CCNA_03920 [Caulobacter vibrioides NA1000]AVH77117.1 hypothetical protein CA607_20205 [Caulobacter vibrioides]QXZ53911.1 hypothetical protein KZH45_02305 [Caulobacter vibrioides]